MGNPQEIHHSTLHEKSISPVAITSQANKRYHEDIDNDRQIDYQDLPGFPDLLLCGNGTVSKKFKKDINVVEGIITRNKPTSESLMERVWGKHNTSMTPEERQKFLATPPIWAPALRHVISYNNPSTAHPTS